MQIAIVVGARPQFVKAAVVCSALKAMPDVQTTLIHTGQHYDSNMSDVFFDELSISRPDICLEIGSGPQGRQTGRMLEMLEKHLEELKPDWTVVFGDTNSTLAGALASVKLHIPVAHVEAGLRSFNRRMPEEINRVVTDHVAFLHLCPTETAVANLTNEGIRDGVHLVGDVMYDTTIRYRQLAETKSCVLDKLGLKRREFVLATIHRAENTDDPVRLRTITESLIQIARQTTVVLPIHPRTRSALQRDGLYVAANESLILIDPVGYLDMLMLETNAKLIATDSGGVQKEAFFCHVPCVTLRDETEWVELVKLGWNTLAPPSSTENVVRAVTLALAGSRNLPADSKPYGDGQAAFKIARLLTNSTVRSLVESPLNEDQRCAALTRSEDISNKTNHQRR